MYGQDQAKQPPISGQEKEIHKIAIDMANSMDGHDPANQNEIIRALVCTIRERREIQLKDAQSHAKYIAESLDALNGVPVLQNRSY